MNITVMTNHNLTDDLSRVTKSVINTDLDDSVLVVKWNWLRFDQPTPLVNVRDLLAGDTIWTLHKGKAVITEVLKGFFRFDGGQDLFAVQPQMSFPLVSRGDHGDATVYRDW